MPLQTNTRFYVRCDRCTARLRANPAPHKFSENAVLTFSDPLRAIHHATEQGWTVTAIAVYCPSCAPTVDPETKEA